MLLTGGVFSFFKILMNHTYTKQKDMNTYKDRERERGMLILAANVQKDIKILIQKGEERRTGLGEGKCVQILISIRRNLS